MSAGEVTRLVIARVRGRLYVRDIPTWSNLVSQEPGVAWGAAESFLEFPGPVMICIEQAKKWADRIAEAIKDQGGKLASERHLYLDFDPDKKMVREFGFAVT